MFSACWLSLGVLAVSFTLISGSTPVVSTLVSSKFSSASILVHTSSGITVSLVSSDAISSRVAVVSYTVTPALSSSAEQNISPSSSNNIMQTPSPSLGTGATPIANSVDMQSSSLSTNMMSDDSSTIMVTSAQATSTFQYSASSSQVNKDIISSMMTSPIEASSIVVQTSAGVISPSSSLPQPQPSSSSVVSPQVVEINVHFTLKVSSCDNEQQIRDNVTDGLTRAFKKTHLNAPYDPALKSLACEAPLPKPAQLYIEMELDMSWKSFCSLRNEFRLQLSQNVYDKGGNERIAQDTVQFVDVDETKIIECVGSGKLKEYPAKVIFYISDKSDKKKVDMENTKKAADFLMSLVENGQTMKLGPAFDKRISSVKSGGKEAKESKKLSELERVAIGVGATIGGILLIMFLIWVIGKCRNKPSNNQEKKEITKADFNDIEDGSGPGLSKSNGNDNAAFVGDNAQGEDVVKTESETANSPPVKNGEATTVAELNGNAQKQKEGNKEEIEMAVPPPPPPPPPPASPSSSSAGVPQDNPKDEEKGKKGEDEDKIEDTGL